MVSLEGQKLTVDIPNIFNLKSGADSEIKINSPADGEENASVIYVVYKAVVNDQAVTGSSADDSLKNTARLEFTNDPYTNGTGTTPDDSTQQYTYGIDITKHENTIDGEGLEGAGFSFLKAKDLTADGAGKTLDGHDGCPTAGAGPIEETQNQVALFTKDSEGNYTFAGWADVTSNMLADNQYVASKKGETAHMHEGMLCETLNKAKQGIGRNGVEDSSVVYYTVLKTIAGGKLHIEGLDTGAYTVIESLTPNGHDVMSKWSFQIKADTLDESKATVTFEGASFVNGNYARIQDVKEAGDGIGEIDLVNVQGIDLPVTGGMGTALFIGAGVVLVVTACAYTAARKHRAAEDAE